MPMAASIAKWGATVSPRLGVGQKRHFNRQPVNSGLPR